MPYISKEKRKLFDDKILLLVDALQDGNVDNPPTAGDLNYVISELLSVSLDIGANPRYNKINTAVGVLECVKLEFYRRLAGPYEDIKIAEQGDISVYARFTEWLSKYFC